MFGFDEPFAHPVPSFNTPVNPPSSEPDEGDLVTVCFSAEWLKVVTGALMALTLQSTWAGTPEEIEQAQGRAQMLMELFNSPVGVCSIEAPYWDDPEADDASAIEPANNQDWYGQLQADPETGDLAWHERLSIWAVTAFVAVVGTPLAALQFFIIAPKVVFAFRGGFIGGIAKIFCNGLEVASVDTYRNNPGELIELAVDLVECFGGGMGAMDMGANVWVALSDEQNPAVEGQATLQVLRKRLQDATEMSYQLRQSPDNSCLLEQSSDGTTWTTAFDFSICIPPATQTIMETVINNNTWVNPFSPSVTFISLPGYDDGQKDNAYAALCYACTMLVDAMCSANLSAKQGTLTAETVTAIAVGLAGTILAIFATGFTFGVLMPVALAIASATLASIAAIEGLSEGVWSDTDNKAALACLALANLTNVSVDLTNFKTAFAGADCLTSDQQDMAEIFTSELANVATEQTLFDDFMNAIGSANAAAQSGVLGASCVCDDTTWSYCVRPSNARGMVTLEDIVDSPTCEANSHNVGTVNEGADRWDQSWDGSGVASCQPVIRFFIPSGSALTSAYAYGSFGSGVRVGGYAFNGGAPVCGAGIGIPADHVGALVTTSGQTVELAFAMANNAAVADGYVDYLIISGTGASPFGTCTTC